MSTMAFRIRQAAEILAGITDDLAQQILALPDNPVIRRLDDSRCFVVRFRDLGDCWSPFYHDFRAQYRAIVERISTLSPGAALAFLRYIANGGVFKRNGYKRPERLHPSVLKYLDTLLIAEGA